MRGSEYLEIETLYDLELQLLQYPGLELESVLLGSMVEYEDEDGDIGMRFEPLSDELLLFRFKGPEFSNKGRPLSIVPVATDAVDAEIVQGFAIEKAVVSLEGLIKNGSESRP